MALNGLTRPQKWYFSGTSRGKNQSVTPRKASNGAWRSPVAHLLWEQGVPSSNLGAPTEFFEKDGGGKPCETLMVMGTAGSAWVSVSRDESGGYTLASGTLVVPYRSTWPIE